jgi:hypothetical protein
VEISRADPIDSKEAANQSEPADEARAAPREPGWSRSGHALLRSKTFPPRPEAL